MDRKDGAQGRGACCNLDYLLINLGRNEEAARRLVGLFLENYPNLVWRLDESLMHRDLGALQRVVHDIRGSCVLFSAREALEQTHRIENLLRDCPANNELGSNGVDWDVELRELRESLARMADELKHYLAGNVGDSADVA